MTDFPFGQDFVVACVVATEVPPEPTGAFTAAMIGPAIQAVCEVIRNRSADPAFPNDPVSVVLEKNQFSAVCRQDYWIKAMAGLWFPLHVGRCLDIWQQNHSPTVGAAKWYYSPISMQPVNAIPSWAASKTEIPLPSVSAEYFRWFA